MEMVVELFNEDSIAHPWNPHVFVVPRLITYIWQKNLLKEADLFFEVAVGELFWSKEQHEPLIIAIVLPLTHVPNHRGPWVAKGTDKSQQVQLKLTKGFKLGTKHDTGGLYVVDGVLRPVWKDKERRSGRVLREFLARAGRMPPVQKCLVRGMLQGPSRRPFS